MRAHLSATRQAPRLGILAAVLVCTPLWPRDGSACDYSFAINTIEVYDNDACEQLGGTPMHHIARVYKCLDGAYLYWGRDPNCAWCAGVSPMPESCNDNIAHPIDGECCELEMSDGLDNDDDGHADEGSFGICGEEDATPAVFASSRVHSTKRVDYASPAVDGVSLRLARTWVELDPAHPRSAGTQITSTDQVPTSFGPGWRDTFGDMVLGVYAYDPLHPLEGAPGTLAWKNIDRSVVFTKGALDGTHYNYSAESAQRFSLQFYGHLLSDPDIVIEDLATHQTWTFEYYPGACNPLQQAFLVKLAHTDSSYAVNITRDSDLRITTISDVFFRHLDLQYDNLDQPALVTGVRLNDDDQLLASYEYDPGLFLSRVNYYAEYERYLYTQNQLSDIIAGADGYEENLEHHDWASLTVTGTRGNGSHFGYSYDTTNHATTQYDLDQPQPGFTGPCSPTNVCAGPNPPTDNYGYGCFSAADHGDGKCYRYSTYSYDSSTLRVNQWTGVCPQCGDGVGQSAHREYYDDANPPTDSNTNRVKWVTDPKFDGAGAGSRTTYSWSDDGTPECIVENDDDDDAHTGMICEGVCCGSAASRITAYDDSVPNQEDETRDSVLLPGSNVTTTRVKDDAGRLLSETTTGYTMRMVGENPPTWTPTQITSETKYHYDAYGRVDWIDGPLDNITQGYDKVDFAYHDSGADKGHLLTVTRYVGASGCPTTNCLQLVTHYADYDNFGTARRITDPSGVVTTITTDSRGRVTKIAKTVGANDYDATNYSYQGDRLLKVVRGNTCVTFEFNSRGALRAKKRSSVSDGACGTVPINDSSGEVERYTYATTADPEGDPGRLTTVQRLIGGSIKYTRNFDYDAKRQRTWDASLTTGKGTQWAFDEDGLLAMEKLANCDGPSCTRTDFSSDRFGRRTVVERYVTDFTRSKTAFGYSSVWNVLPTTLTTGLGAFVATTTSYTYDDFGNMVEVVSPDSGRTRFLYDLAGRLIERMVGVGTTADERHTLYQYDSLGRLTFIDQDESESCASLGDNQPLGDVHYTYDVCTGSPFQTCTYVEGRLRTIRVDVYCLGHVPVSRFTFNRYDAKGHLFSEQIDYGGDSRSTVYWYTDDGELSQIDDPWDVAHQYLYSTTTGEVSTVREAAGTNYATNVSYAPFGPATWYWAGSFQAGGYSLTRSRILDAQYQVTGEYSNNGGAYQGASWLYTRDATGRVTKRDSLYSTTNVIDRWYCYDRLGRLTHDQIVDNTSGCTDTATNLRGRFTYFDGASVAQPPDNRATGLQRNANITDSSARSYNFASSSDKLGTITSGTSTITYGSDAVGRTTSDGDSAYGYDDRIFTYGPNGRLIQISGSVPSNIKTAPGWTYTMAFARDDRGRVFNAAYRKTVMGTGTTVTSQYYLYYDMGDRLIAAKVVPDDTASPYVLWSYFYLGNEVVGAQRQYYDGTNTTVTKMAFLNDQHGVPYHVIDTAGNTMYLGDMEAFGWRQPKVVVANMWMPFGLPGQVVLDETVSKSRSCGLVTCSVFTVRPPIALNGAREYDPYTGRFLEPDPLVVAMPGARPRVYTYSDNDAANSSDPTGLWAAHGCSPFQWFDVFTASCAASAWIVGSNAWADDVRADMVNNLWSADYYCNLTPANPDYCGAFVYGGVELYEGAFSDPCCAQGYLDPLVETIVHEVLHKTRCTQSGDPLCEEYNHYCFYRPATGGECGPYDAMPCKDDPQRFDGPALELYRAMTGHARWCSLMRPETTPGNFNDW